MCLLRIIIFSILLRYEISNKICLIWFGVHSKLDDIFLGISHFSDTQNINFQIFLLQLLSLFCLFIIIIIIIIIIIFSLLLRVLLIKFHAFSQWREWMRHSVEKQDSDLITLDSW